MFFITVVGLSVVFAFPINPAHALLLSDRAKAQCDTASRNVAVQENVPLNVLKAIARTESGVTRDGTFAPWPWTVNVEGNGSFFPSKREAEHFIKQALRRGHQNIDIGCFQLNYRWHGENFATISDMLDPAQNASYAARFLSELYREFGDWENAAGAYHSRTKSHFDNYLKRFLPILASVTAGTEKTSTPFASRQATNGYPILQPGLTGQRHGSLFPLGVAPRNSLFANHGRQD